MLESDRRDCERAQSLGNARMDNSSYHNRDRQEAERYFTYEGYFRVWMIGAENRQLFQDLATNRSSRGKGLGASGAQRMP